MSGNYREASTEVRRYIRDHHGRELTDCDGIREHAAGMSESWTGRLTESTADGLVVAIFARSTDTLTCAVRNSGWATGHRRRCSRSLFEDTVDIHWIPTAANEAEARYKHRHDHSRMLLAETMATFTQWYPDLDIPEFDAEERKRLDDLFR